MNRNPILAIIFSILFIGFSFPLLHAAESVGEETLFSSAIPPNVLIILDNSNSMDEDFFGNGVGSWATGSKSVEGKRILRQLVNAYANTMRLGLMTYRLPSVAAGYIANSAYFVSYEPKSYCPNPPGACVEYCRTGSSTFQGTCQAACAPENSLFEATYIDNSISGFSYGSAERNKYCGLAYPKTNRVPNPLDKANYIYFKQALPFYTDSQWMNSFWVASPYTADDDYRDDSYCLYSTKTGTSDGIPTQDCGAGGTGSTYGYSDYWSSTGVEPTDSDLALGYNEFGRRMATFNVGQSWRANSSPGAGYLHVPVEKNGSDNQQLNSLLKKMTTYENDPAGYMGTCQDTSNPNNCSYILSAGLTPTAGTLQSAISYFQGSSSPTQASCQQNFIVYVTDGLPSVDENGVPGTADSLLPAVLDKLQRLRSLTVGSYTRTYVVGVGLSSEAKAKLDTMAVAGGTDIDGQAYYADDPAQLQEALTYIFSQIQPGTYSFSLPSVSSVRVEDENDLYVASFEPLQSATLSEPFWKGHLKKKTIGNDGSLVEIWDAGDVLEGTAESSRLIKTYIGGALMDFTEAIDPSYFGSNKETVQRDQIVGFIRGKTTLPIVGKNGEKTTLPNPDTPRKLGDIFRSNPVTIATPSLFFNDSRDKKLAFDKFRKNHQRTSRDGTRIVIAGANDGQVHAFETGQGKEVWSFVPPNLLPRLSSLVHTTQSANKSHPYLVDGPISAAEVWLPASDSDGTEKSESEWKTLLVFGLGTGSADYLWSKSPSCDQDFKDKYNPPHQYYCGYYALDVTNTTNYPTFKWTLKPGSQGDHLGEPWSKMVMGRVRINGNEKWVGFVGGGYAPSSGKGGDGKGFFVVDLNTGNILWSFTAAQDGNMGAVPGSPAIVDRDNDGFIDTAYVGDMSGNLWKFTFCPFNPAESEAKTCNTANWAAVRMYDPESNKAPIFATPAVAKESGYHWVFWGTGDKISLSAAKDNKGTPPPQDRFFALKDQDLNRTYKWTDLDDFTLSPSGKESVNIGWHIDLPWPERVLSDATVYKGIVFFTTYTPPSTGADLCTAKGSSALYGIAMMPVVINGTNYKCGMQVFTKIDFIEMGIASAPVISQKPIVQAGRESSTPDVFIALSGGETGTKVISSAQAASAIAGSGPSSFIIHWKDRRVQPY